MAGTTRGVAALRAAREWINRVPRAAPWAGNSHPFGVQNAGLPSPHHFAGSRGTGVRSGHPAEGSRMSDADALLDAIFDNPDDDTPRLVYADWLQEHGQANYAEFIRLQCAAAR